MGRTRTGFHDWGPEEEEPVGLDDEDAGDDDDEEASSVLSRFCAFFNAFDHDSRSL